MALVLLIFSEGEGVIRQKISAMELDQPWKFISLGVFYSLFHSLLEEYYWRWFVFGQLRRLVPFWPAVVISSLGFMAHHVVVVGAYFGMASRETWLISFSIATGGVFWAWLYQRSGSLVGPWLSHLLVDSAIFAIGYEIARELIEAREGSSCFTADENRGCGWPLKPIFFRYLVLA